MMKLFLDSVQSQNPLINLIHLDINTLVPLYNTLSIYNRLIAYAFAARASGTDGISFDSDSFDIAMDNCASHTMTFCASDFITPIIPADISYITGAGGSVPIQGMGDVEYFVTDGDGTNHLITIKNALFVPGLPFRLLAISQLAKQIEKVENSEGTGIFSFGWHSKFKWNKVSPEYVSSTGLLNSHTKKKRYAHRNNPSFLPTGHS